MKTCGKCKVEKPKDSFHNHKATKDRLRSECKECSNTLTKNYRKGLGSDSVHKTKVKLRSRQRRLDNPEKLENTRLKSKYGITLDEYKEMSANQDALCAICDSPETMIDRQSNKVKKLAVDHCHKTGKVRGLLCSACNTALGRFRDSVEILQKTIRYLNGKAE